jgi:uncharacterized membrane protein YdjX (TVP38/TMEM64 family)
VHRSSRRQTCPQARGISVRVSDEPNASTAAPVSEGPRFDRWVRAIVALTVVSLVIWFFASGARDDLSAESVRDAIHGLGPLGPLAFIVVFAVIQPLGPSGHIFVIAASLLWSPPVAVGFAMLGALSAQTTGFYFYRYLAADFARARIPARLHRYEKVLVEKPFRTVLVLRLLTFTAPLVTMLLGVSRVRYVPMMAATVVGIFPNLVFDVYIGGKLVEWLFD